LTTQTLASAEEDIRKLSGQMYDEVKKEIGAKADGKLKAEGLKESRRQDAVRKDSSNSDKEKHSSDSSDDFKVDLLEGASTIGAGMKVAKMGLEVFDDRKADPGASKHGATIESTAKPQMYNEGFTPSKSSDFGADINEIKTVGDYPITYTASNAGESLNNSDLQGVFSTVSAAETAMETTIQLSRSLNFGIQKELGNAIQQRAELSAQQSQNINFGINGMQMAHNRPEQGPKGYTYKEKERESNSSESWA